MVIFVTTQIVTDHLLQGMVHTNIQSKYIQQEQAKLNPDTEEFTIGCRLCFMEFNSEEACDAHDCPHKKKPNPSIKKEPKVDTDNVLSSNGNKRSTHSSQNKKLSTYTMC